MKKEEEAEEIKCVYDSRIYKEEQDDSDYLKTVNKDKIPRKDSFKDFLNASFNADKKSSKVKGRSAYRTHNKINKYITYTLCYYYSVRWIHLTRKLTNQQQCWAQPQSTALTLRMTMNMKVSPLIVGQHHLPYL